LIQPRSTTIEVDETELTYKCSRISAAIAKYTETITLGNDISESDRYKNRNNEPTINFGNFVLTEI
jgi:hypothetical protein